jgi:signal transduction histidine kinase
LEVKLAAESEKLRREAEAKSEAERATERVIVAYLCHEIRNPFNGVFGFAELIEAALARLQKSNKTNRSAHAKDFDEVREWCSNIIINSEHIRDILDNVLDLSQLEQGTLELRQAPILVAELGEQICLLQRSTLRKGVSLVIEVEPQGLVIEGDHQRWRQMLINLVSNAIKFTHEGMIIVRLRQCNVDDTSPEASALRVEVCDTGMGISELEQARLFQKYRTRYQQHDSLVAKSEDEKRLTKGTGLGLVIAQRIAKLLGTRIEIESPWKEGRLISGAGAQVSKGARFFFTVTQCVVNNANYALYSRSPTETGLTRVRPNNNDGSDLNHNRILVVDDDMVSSERLTIADLHTKHHTPIVIAARPSSHHR